MTDPTTPPPVRPFAAFLQEQAKGQTHAELSEGLRDLVARVRDTGKKGSLTLTITVEPMTKGSERALMVSDEIKLKLPEHDRDTSLFFADNDHNLTRNDPDQLALPTMALVDRTTGEVTDLPAPSTATERK